MTPCKDSSHPGWGDPTDCSACGNGQRPKADNTGCEACPAGKYGTAGGKCNKNCAANTETNDAGNGCTDCPLGFVATADSPECSKCSPGQHVVSGSCQACLRGRYSSNAHYAGNHTCAHCPGGRAANAGKTACSNCTGTRASWQTPGVCTVCGDGKAPAKDAGGVEHARSAHFPNCEPFPHRTLPSTQLALLGIVAMLRHDSY